MDQQKETIKLEVCDNEILMYIRNSSGHKSQKP